MRQRLSTFDLQGTKESYEVVEEDVTNDPSRTEFQTTNQIIWGYVPEIAPNSGRCHCLEKQQ